MKLNIQIPNKKILIGMLSVLFVLTIAACGQGVSPGTVNQSLSGSNPATSPDLWKGVDTMGVVAGGPFDGMPIIKIDTQNLMLILTFTLPTDPFGLAGEIAIPQLPDATVAMGDDSNGVAHLQLSIPLHYLVKNPVFTDPTTLPNGDALPAIPGGELPHLATKISAQQTNLYLYGNVKYFAVFVPTPKVNPFVDLTFPIKNADKTKILGYVSSVSAKGGFDGGFYVAFIMPPELATVLDTLFD